MSTLAGKGDKAMLTATSPCALPWLLPEPEPSPATSSQLYFSDGITSWRERYRMLEAFQSVPLYLLGVQWEMGGSQPDPSCLPNEGKEGSG